MKKLLPRFILAGMFLLITSYVLLQMIPDEVVKRAEVLRAPLFILTVIAGFVFAFFIFVTLLKKRISFLPNLSIVFGVFGYLLVALLFHEDILSRVVAHTLEEAMEDNTRTKNKVLEDPVI